VSGSDIYIRHALLALTARRRYASITHKLAE